MKPLLPSNALIKDSTSNCNHSLPAQACFRKARLSPASKGNAAWNRVSSCCQSLFAIVDLTSQPGFRHVPISHYGNRGYVQYLGGLFYAEPAEVSQFHNLALSRIDRCQFLECFIQRDQFIGLCSRYHIRVLERHLDVV